jgi:hypothetical protein
MRAALRDHYRPFAWEAGRRLYFNPGNCWVSARCRSKPKVAVAAIASLLEPHIRAGRLTVHLRSKAAAVETQDDCIVSVTVISLDVVRALRFVPPLFIDATELGDLLPLAGRSTWLVRRRWLRPAKRSPAVERKPACVQELYLCVRARASAASASGT